jgi:hypothetical protein
MTKNVSSWIRKKNHRLKYKETLLSNDGMKYTWKEQHREKLKLVTKMPPNPGPNPTLNFAEA